MTLFSPSRLRIALLLVAAGAGCTNFHVVEPGRAYRSAQPCADDLRSWIDAYGIRTIVQVRGGSDAEIAALVEQEGVHVVRVPLSARAFPSAEQLVALWDAFAAAEEPLLIHCRAGADRTGLASAIYVLQRTDDLDEARAQLALLYGHTGYGTSRLDRVLDMYGRWHGRMDFRRWATTLYHPPTEPRASDRE